MNDVAVKVEGLGKRYRLGQREPYKTLRETVRRAGAAPVRAVSSVLHREQTLDRPSSDEFIWALKDVSFEVNRGEVLGIIGRNGAGKSTLLKVLSRITEPTEGWAEVYGRVGSLLEVGTGFHPELTGRENVYLNGAILGMRKTEIDRKFDDIVSFAEIAKFLDTPVKRYSSGMYVRLAFAVAAHLEPEILVVDEVLAVGDAAFQKKCMGKMGDVATQGRTVLFVSHNMKAVSTLCSSAILLSEGSIVSKGTTAEVIQAYQQQWSEVIESGQAEVSYPEDPTKSAQITSIRILDKAGRPSLRHDFLDPIDIEIGFVLREDYPTLLIDCEVRSSDGTLVYATQDTDWRNYTEDEKADQFPREAGVYEAIIHAPAPLLNTGRYEIEVYLTIGPARIDTRKGIAFEVVEHDSFASFVSKSPRGGTVIPPVRWDVRRVGDRVEPSSTMKA